jgi:hypothetical protein
VKYTSSSLALLMPMVFPELLPFDDDDCEASVVLPEVELQVAPGVKATAPEHSSLATWVVNERNVHAADGCTGGTALFEGVTRQYRTVEAGRLAEAGTVKLFEEPEATPEMLLFV